MSRKEEIQHDLEDRMLIPGRELASLMGVDISTIKRWVTQGYLPQPVRIGGRVLWRAGILNEWLQQNCPHMDDFITRPTVPYKKAAQ